jgi:hypothetical protein
MSSRRQLGWLDAYFPDRYRVSRLSVAICPAAVVRRRKSAIASSWSTV